MKFAARHVSFEQIDGASVFALGEMGGLAGEAKQESYVVLQFGGEDDQDRGLGLTGLHLESSQIGLGGYGLVDNITYDGRVVSIHCSEGRDIHAEIESEMMTETDIGMAVEQCNQANGRHEGETAK